MFFSAQSPKTNTRNASSSSSSSNAPNDPISSLPFPIMSSPYSANLDTSTRLWMDHDSQPPFEYGTPSSASSSSPHRAITPVSLDDGGAAVRVETGEDSNMLMDVEFDGGTHQYIIPPLMALESDSAMKSSVYPRLSTATLTPYVTRSTWQFDNADSGVAWLRATTVQARPDAVSHTHSARAFHEQSPDEVQRQRHADLYPNHALNYTIPFSVSTPAHIPASPPSGQSSPFVSPPASISRSSLSSRFTCQNSIPLHQPQPIRPIPIIPLSVISSSVSEDFSTFSTHKEADVPDSHSTTNLLSPSSLLCQPVSDTIRYQLQPVSITDSHHTTGRAFSHNSASGDSPTEHRYSNDLPKVVGGFFCVCGCLGLKHTISEAESWPQS